MIKILLFNILLTNSISELTVIDYISSCQYNKHNFSIPVYLAIIKVESDFKIKSVGPKGEYGLMQITPTILKKYKVSKKNYFNPKINVCTGIRYLEELYSETHNKIKAIEKYNGNPEYLNRFYRWYFYYAEVFKK